MTADTIWPKTSLGAIAEFRNGVNYDKRSFGKGVKVIGVKDFQDFTTPKYELLEEINPEGVVTSKSLVRDGDIVFVRSNGNRELIGRSLFIKSPPEEVTHSAFTIRVRFLSADVLPQFYAFLFRTPLIRKSLTAFGGGTNISNLNQDILSRLEVPLPPRALQCRIAGVLSSHDDLLENNQRRIHVLEEMARLIYREWFVDFRFPGFERASFIDSTIGRIPKGWTVTTLGEIAEINERSIKRGAEPGSIGYVDIASVSSGTIDRVQHVAFRDAPGRARRLVRDGDTIWSCVRPNRRSFALIHEPDPSLVVSTGFAVLSPRDGRFSYLYLAVTTDELPPT